MNELLEKEKNAIKYLQMFEPKTEPYYLCYSGGKDSDVIRILAQLAGVNHECKHNLTTADAPETVSYVKATIGSENISKARYDDGTHKTMWNLIPKKLIPPTRLARYCCEHLKERGGEGRLKITGVRWAESLKRKENADFVKIIGKPIDTMKAADGTDSDAKITKQGNGVILRADNTDNRRVVEHCYRDRSTTINPIVDWSDSDVWKFLRHYGCTSNPLYGCGFNRVGCCVCPLGGSKQMKREASIFPKMKENYIRAFDRMLFERKNRGLQRLEKLGDTGEEVFRWWVGDDPNQITFSEYLANIDD